MSAGKDTGSTAAFLTAPFQRKRFGAPTCVDADEGALGDVIEAADAPALVLRLEELQPDLQPVLHQPVGAHVDVALAPLVALVNAAREENDDTSRNATHRARNGATGGAAAAGARQSRQSVSAGSEEAEGGNLG